MTFTLRPPSSLLRLVAVLCLLSSVLCGPTTALIAAALVLACIVLGADHTFPPAHP